MINCDKCGGQTKPKQITSKKDQKVYTVYECQGNCMSENGRFKYTCFAPRVPNTTTPQTNGVKPSGDAVAVLKSIDTSLKNILTILQAKSGKMPIQPEEMQPDESVPF